MKTINKQQFTIELLSRILGKNVLPSDGITTLAEWDSVAHIEIVFEVEEFIKRDLTEEEMNNIVTVQTIINFIEKES